MPALLWELSKKQHKNIFYFTQYQVSQMLKASGIINCDHGLSRVTMWAQERHIYRVCLANHKANGTAMEAIPDQIKFLRQINRTCWKIQGSSDRQWQTVKIGERKVSLILFFRCSEFTLLNDVQHQALTTWCWCLDATVDVSVQSQQIRNLCGWSLSSTVSEGLWL